MVITVHVYVVLMVHNVKLIIDHVNQLLVGIMVYFIQFLYYDKYDLFSGTCNETSNTTFECSCENGWRGIHCEAMVNYCENVKCLNNGVCRPLFLNFTCECLGTSYSGRYCEITAKTTVVHKAVTKSFGYIAILCLIGVVSFFVIMDILKYCFDIDPLKEELEKIRKAKLAKKAKHPSVIQRFVYVNVPPQ
jgi:hypothetical protein